MEKTAVMNVVKACQSGNTEQFGVLYDMYVDKIYAFVYHRTGHTQTAEDLTSDVFFKVFEKIQTFNDQGGSFTVWLYTIARNTVYDHYRTQRSLADIDAFWDIEARDDIEHTAALRMTLEKVHGVLRQLSEEQQELLRLRLWDGLSHVEIAAVLGKTEAACKMAYSRALRDVRSKLPDGIALLLLIKLTLL